jgi:hypothetical protein
LFAALLLAWACIPTPAAAQSFQVPGAISSGAARMGAAAQNMARRASDELTTRTANAANSGLEQLQGNAVAGSGFPSANGLNINGTWPVPGGSESVDPGATTPVVPASLPSGPSEQPAHLDESPARPPVSDTGLDAALWSLDSSQDARQAGQSFPAARMSGVADATDYRSRVWLEEWHRQLTDTNIVSEDRFWFQARRLDRPEFALWASRQVWAAGPLISRAPASVALKSVDVGLTAPVPPAPLQVQSAAPASAACCCH